MPLGNRVIGKRLDKHDDQQLVAAALGGDLRAFETLYDRHKKRVYGLCLRMMHNPADAEDLTQDTFLQLFRKLKTFRGEAAFTTWLHRMAVNTVLMWLRKRRIATVSFDEPDSRHDHEDFETPRQLGEYDSVLNASGERLDLISAIDELPPGYRLVFILHDIEGYEHCEIAEMLACTVGNSKSQLHKARMKLRSLLRAGAKPISVVELRRRAARAQVLGALEVSASDREWRRVA